MLNVALSGQEMRAVRVDTNRRFGSTAFVNAVRGSLVLPNAGAWSIVQGRNDDIEPLQGNTGLALVRYNSSPLKYEFSEPADDPVNKFGLVHSSNSHRTLFLQPHIIKNEPVIISDQPYFADLYSLKNSHSYFPSLSDCFSVGAGEGKLKIHGSGLLEMVSSGIINIAGKPRILSHSANFKSYIEYADTTGSSSTGKITINSQQPDSWAVDINEHRLVYDVESFNKLFIFSFNFKSSYLKKAELSKPKVEYGSFLKTLTDILRFLEDFDPAEPFELDLTNNASHKNLGFKIKSAFKIKLEFSIFPVHFKIKYPEKGSMQVIGPEPPKPPEFYVQGALYIGAYSLQKPDGKVSDGLIIMIKVEAGIKVLSITSLDAVYAIGLVEYEVKIENATGKIKHALKMGVGAAIRIRVGYLEIEVNRCFGAQLEEGDWSAFISQKGELEIATFVIGIEIEGKAEVERKAVDGEDKTYGKFELSLVIEISAAYIINFEFEFSWEEEVKLV